MVIGDNYPRTATRFDTQFLGGKRKVIEGRAENGKNLGALDMDDSRHRYTIYTLTNKIPNPDAVRFPASQNLIQIIN